MSEPSKCGICGEPGHNRRRHRDDVGPDVPALAGEPVLFDQMQASIDQSRIDRALDARPSEVARRALAEARDRKATGDDAPAPATAPEPSGLDEFLPAVAKVVHPAEADRLPYLSGPASIEPDPTRCPACGAALTNGESFLCDRCTEEWRDDEAGLVEDEDGAPLPPEQQPCRCLGSGPTEVHRHGAPGCIYDGPAEAEPVKCPECFGETDAHDPGCPDAARPTEAAHWEAEPDDGGLSVWDDPGPDGGAPDTWAPWRTELGPDGPLKICLPGVYDLPADVYHDPAVTGDWLSNSDARQLIAPGCPAKFRHNRDNGIRKTSDAFDLGHAVHTRMLGKGETIVARPDEWDSWRTKASQQWKAEQRAAGRTVILPEQLAVVEAMAAAVWADPDARALLTQAGQAEACMFWIDPETGVQRRAMVDYLAEQPVDLKTSQSACPGFDMDAKIYKFAYHRQAATILDGIEALNLPFNGEFNLIYVETEAPYVPQVVKLDDIAQTVGRNENRSAIELYARCLETNTWPGYADGPVYASVPGYIARDHIEEMEIG